MRKIIFVLLLALLLFSCQRDVKKNGLFSIKPIHNGYELRIYSSGQTQIFELKRTNSDGIHIPVRGVVVFSSTHVGFICRLGQQERIIALPDTSYICCQGLKKRFPELTQIGDEISPDFEEIIELRPDVVFISGYSPSQMERFSRLTQAGIAVVPILEYRETDPLLRARWIEVFGAFFDKYDQAKKIFNKIEKNYNLLSRNLANYLAKNSIDSPLVLVNIPYRGTWYVPGGQSYMARFLKDAGADYPWSSSTSSQSLPLSFEQVYQRAAKADFLINPNLAMGLEQVISTDRRLAGFKAVREGRVYNFIRRKRGKCFDFWESGVVNPDKILSDLINIFYPHNTFASDTMFYYQKLN